MKNCLTKKIAFQEVSGCLVEKPECGYAHKFGFSFVCTHPDHSKFNAHLAGKLTKDDALELYDALRRKRRDEFTANLDETSKDFFSFKTGLFGQPQTNMALNEQH